MIDKIIVSSDEYFKGFFPIVYKAWKKFFPERLICCAFVTDRGEQDDYVQELRGIYDEVRLFKEIKNIPTKNQAKLARFIMASEMQKSICMIEDVDTIPLQRYFFEDKLRQRENGKILAVGQEVYKNEPHHKNFPVSTVTSEGYNFKKLINPEGKSDQDLFDYFISIADNSKTNVLDSDFSDEWLIYKLSQINNIDNIQHVERDVDIHADWIDRSWWHINQEKLFSGKYVTCNFKRPFEQHQHEFIDIIKYIDSY